jgi:hypothetical protein
LTTELTPELTGGYPGKDKNKNVRQQAHEKAYSQKASISTGFRYTQFPHSPAP